MSEYIFKTTERNEAKLCLYSSNMHRALYEVKEYMRKRDKYASDKLSDETREFIGLMREEISEIIFDHVDLEGIYDE